MRKFFLFTCLLMLTVPIEAQHFDMVGFWRLEALDFIDPQHLIPKPQNQLDSLMQAMRLEEMKKSIMHFDSTGYVSANTDPSKAKYEFLTPEYMEMGRIIYSFAIIDNDCVTLTENRAGGNVKAVMRLRRVKMNPGKKE